ncbi:CPBP family intramembrane metalloprotease, partial [Rhodococcus sp. IEGM 1354]|nr:CPBP family intramembrane metalloprotease [Rhodococcus sp. IEGM 1354]
MIDFRNWLTTPPPESTAPPHDARERTTIKVEIAIVLVVTLGLSGMSSILSLIEDSLQTAALSDQT